MALELPAVMELNAGSSVDLVWGKGEVGNSVLERSRPAFAGTASRRIPCRHDCSGSMTALHAPKRLARILPQEDNMAELEYGLV